MPGSGSLTITGQLGDVMKESAQAALSWVRGHWKKVAPELEEDWFANHDIHIHVPAGAVPKDGPSAGVAMTVALSSLISGRPVRNEVAMTGEVTLTGQVLPIGGLKEKSLAAQRAGIKRVIVPERNDRRRRRNPREGALGARVRLRRRGLQGDRRGSVLSAMEVAEALGTSAPGHRHRRAGAARDWVAARSSSFWIVAAITLLAAGLRFATLGVQSYHHDEIVTAQRILGGGFGRAMEGVNTSESAPPLYYALAWLWTAADRDRRVRPALALGPGRGGDRAGRLPDRAGAA